MQINLLCGVRLGVWFLVVRLRSRGVRQKPCMCAAMRYSLHNSAAMPGDAVLSPDTSAGEQNPIQETRLPLIWP